MPKIIPDIAVRIEQGALTLFKQYDYNQVDMKMIAKECNIAVGTLYNYYPNKHQLFIHALREAWIKTAYTLDTIFQTYPIPEECLSHSIECLYDDISLRTGMVKYVYRVLSKLESDDEVKILFNIIFSKIERLFEPFEKKNFSCDEALLNQHLAQSLVLVVQNAIISGTSNREDNLHFIQDFFYNSLHVDAALKKRYLTSH